jgi:1-acyl-sn-glycerol-3-phosphate acyltransferase
MWIIRATGFVLHIALGLFCVLVLFPLMSERQRVGLERWYSGALLRHFRVTPVLDGQWPTQPCMLVLNHVSWLDIFVVNAHSPSIFIAKSEIAAWPLAGTLVSRAGTIFIERGKRQAVHKVIKDAEAKMRAGRQVAVFPEGTTTDGRAVATFHANLFQAAINAELPLIPVALRYRDETGELSTEPAFIGEQTMAENVMLIWKSRRRYTATLVPCNPVHDASWTRHHYANVCKQAIETRLGIQVQTPPEESARQNANQASA